LADPQRRDEQAAGVVAALAKRRQHTVRAQLHDPLRHHLGERDVAVPIHRRAFREGHGRGDLRGLSDSKSRNHETNQGYRRREDFEAMMRHGSLRSSGIEWNDAPKAARC
jgi:hypothetical protein